MLRCMAREAKSAQCCAVCYCTLENSSAAGLTISFWSATTSTTLLLAAGSDKASTQTSATCTTIRFLILNTLLTTAVACHCSRCHVNDAFESLFTSASSLSAWQQTLQPYQLLAQVLSTTDTTILVVCRALPWSEWLMCNQSVAVALHII